MRRKAELHPSSGLHAVLVAVVGVLLATGCSDAYRDSTPTGPGTEPAHIALILPAVQSAAAACSFPRYCPANQ